MRSAPDAPPCRRRAEKPFHVASPMAMICHGSATPAGTSRAVPFVNCNVMARIKTATDMCQHFRVALRIVWSCSFSSGGRMIASSPRQAMAWSAYLVSILPWCKLPMVTSSVILDLCFWGGGLPCGLGLVGVVKHGMRRLPSTTSEWNCKPPMVKLSTSCGGSPNRIVLTPLYLVACQRMFLHLEPVQVGPLQAGP